MTPMSGRYGQPIHVGSSSLQDRVGSLPEATVEE